ncbi:MAG TPA: transposase [Planctomycetaceae bacterium]|nr:transposase [Planctomycetaceae bacterium]
MDRHWLLTWTTYGTWLPGDERGFVGAVRQNSDATQTTHNQPGTEYDRERPHLEGFAKATQKLPTTRLTREQATAVCKQIQATADMRRWKLFAVAVMANHVHAVLGVPGDPEPATLLRDFKSYCARELNKASASATRRRWWTKSGSTRKLPDETAVLAAIRYVEYQDWPLALWIRGEDERPGEPPA